MRFAIGFIVFLLVVWLLVGVIECSGGEDSLPYCIGSSTKSLVVDIIDGFTQ